MPAGVARGEEIDHRMTDKQRDPKAAGPAGATDDTEAVDDAALDIDTAPDAAAPWDQADESVDAAADVTPAAAVAAGKASRGARDRRPKAAPAAPPSVSAQAVHVNDRASAVFVLASIGVFVALFAWALLFGHGGFVARRERVGRPLRIAGCVARSERIGRPERIRQRRSCRIGGARRLARAVAQRRRLAEPGGELGPAASQAPASQAPAMDESRARASEARARMVADQLLTRDIRDQRVLAAMNAVPRERFVPERERDLAYRDGPLSIGAGQTISQPYIVARMVELLHVGPGDRVLEVGTGSGYAAAVLAEIGCRVTSIERDPGLAGDARRRLADLGYADRVDVRTGDGSLGLTDGAPWDGIVVAAAAPAVPPALREQLGDGRRLVIPVGSRRDQQLMVVERHGNEWVETSDGAVVFVPLIGGGGWPG